MTRWLSRQVPTASLSAASIWMCKDGAVVGYNYRLIPIFSDVITPDAEMTALIDEVRAPYEADLARVLGKTESLLYRRGNFNGTFDDLICRCASRGARRRDCAVARLPLGHQPPARSRHHG
jgi:sulfur-oxidizing protein SoxB